MKPEVRDFLAIAEAIDQSRGEVTNEEKRWWDRRTHTLRRVMPGTSLACTCFRTLAQAAEVSRRRATGGRKAIPRS